MACERRLFLMAAPYYLMFRAIALTLRAGSACRHRRFGGFAIFSYYAATLLWEAGRREVSTQKTLSKSATSRGYFLKNKS